MSDHAAVVTLCMLFAILLSVAGHAADQAPPGPARRNDAWHVIGPGGGGGQFCPTVSPHDPNVVLERCDMTGSFLTRDGGRSWRMINFGTVIETFAFDRADPKVMYAGSDALFRTEDGGVTWRMILPDVSRNTVAHLLGDHAGASLTSDDDRLPSPNFRIQAMAAGARRNQLTIGLTLTPPSRDQQGDSFVYRTEDGGATWTQDRALGDEQILAIYCLRREDGSRLVVTNRAVHEYAKGAWTRHAGPGSGEMQLASVGTDTTSGRARIYALTDFVVQGDKLAGGVYASADGGRTWQGSQYDFTPSPQGRRGVYARALTCSEGCADVAYLGVGGVTERGEDGALKAGVGILKTSDGGRTWQVAHVETDHPSPKMEVSWHEPRAPHGGGNIYFPVPLGLGAAPDHPEVCYVTDDFRTYGTRDGGATWHQLMSVDMGENRWTTRGLDVTTNYGVHFDPFDPQRIYISYTDIGGQLSTDGGKTWTSAIGGIPPRWINTTYWVEFDPEVKGLVWGGFSGAHDLPRPKMWRERDPGGYRGGVAVSTDGGLNWTLANEGMPQTAVTHLLLDPTSPVGKRTLYACGFGTGVWKSTDNGRTWALKNSGLTQSQPFAWRLTRVADGTLYVIIARRTDHEIGDNAGAGDLYRSRDGAETWERVNLPEGCDGPNGLAVDPRDPKRLYLAAWGRFGHPNDTGGGLFLSTDAGVTWRNVFSQSQHVYDVTIDPQQPDTLYLCGFDSAAYRSLDAGKTWERIKGYNFKWGHRVIVDPHHPGLIYITTFGGSVWHGPAAGDPNAREDVVPPVPME